MKRYSALEYLRRRGYVESGRIQRPDCGESCEGVNRMSHRMREAMTAMQNVASLMGFELVEVRDKRTGRLYKCDRE